MTNSVVAAANGASLLDRTWPGWYQKVNLETLDAAMGDRCVLAQQGDEPYYGAVTKLWIEAGKPGGDFIKFQAENGFNSTGNLTHYTGIFDTDDDSLTTEWKYQITTRQQSDNVFAPVAEDSLAAALTATLSGATLVVNGKTIVLPDGISLDAVVRLAEVN